MWRKILIAVIILVMLLIVGGGIYYMFYSKSEVKKKSSAEVNTWKPPVITTPTPSPTPTPAPSPTPTAPVNPLATYTITKGKDINPGTDMWSISGTVAECAAKCNKTSGCKGFTRRDPKCWGKSSLVAYTMPGAVAYHKGALTIDPTPAGYTKTLNVDITPGTNMWSMVGAPNQCAAKCNKTTGCKGYVYRPKDSWCWGKSSLKAKKNVTGINAYHKAALVY